MTKKKKKKMTKNDDILERENAFVDNKNKLI